MDQFQPDTVADWIGFLLVVAVALWGGWCMLMHYLDNTPLIEDEPDQQRIAAEHCAKMAHKPVTAQQFRNIMGLVSNEAARREAANNSSNAANIIAGMQSLRTPLPQHRNQTLPADDWEELLALHGVCAEDRADIIRGTKL